LSPGTEEVEIATAVSQPTVCLAGHWEVVRSRCAVQEQVLGLLYVVLSSPLLRDAGEVGLVEDGAGQPLSRRQ